MKNSVKLSESTLENHVISNQCDFSREMFIHFLGFSHPRNNSIIPSYMVFGTFSPGLRVL